MTNLAPGTYNEPTVGTGDPSTCCELAPFTSTLGCQTTLPRGGCMAEVRGVPALSRDSQRLAVPARACPALRAPVSRPLSWPHSQPHGSPRARAQPTLPMAQPGPLRALEDSVPRVLGALYPRISAIQALQETEYSLGSRLQFTLHTFSCFLYLLEFPEMSF